MTSKPRARTQSMGSRRRHNSVVYAGRARSLSVVSRSGKRYVKHVARAADPEARCGLLLLHLFLILFPLLLLLPLLLLHQVAGRHGLQRCCTVVPAELCPQAARSQGRGGRGAGEAAVGQVAVLGFLQADTYFSVL